jgi:Na+/proline symporter
MYKTYRLVATNQNETIDNYEMNIVKDGAYFQFEVPGFNKTNLDVLIEGSELVIEGVRKYKMNGEQKEKQVQKVSFAMMLFLSVLAIFFAFYVDNLQSLIKLTFSISAGVAPVYILRWIWFRINAWSQLSAMLSSAVFTLLYPSFHADLPLSQYPMQEARVLVVTLLTTVIWLLVTFLTPNQNNEVRLKMLPILGSRITFLKRFALAISLGILFLGIVAVSWKIILNS